jgi:hypothetical protein
MNTFALLLVGLSGGACVGLVLALAAMLSASQQENAE